MATLAGVRTAGSADTFAIAQFPDGATYTLDTFYDATSAAGVTPPPMPASASKPALRRLAVPSVAAQANVQIAPSTAYVFSNPTVFLDSTPEQGVAQALQSSGFTTVAEPISLVNLEGVHDASLLYINSHGAADDDLPGIYKGSPTEGSAFELALSDQFDPKAATIPQPYLSLLFTGGSSGVGAQSRSRVDARRLPANIIVTKGNAFATPNELTWAGAHILGADGTVQPGLANVYAATQTFFALQTQITFKPNALAFFNTCWSDDYANFGVRSLIAILESRGVTSYFGFTKTTGYTPSNETANFVFDRWLGEQLPAASAAIQMPPAKEDPPERPFTLGETYAYAQQFKHAAGYNKGFAETYACAPQNVSQTSPFPGCSILDDVADTSGTQLLMPQTLLAPTADTFSIDETQTTPAMTIEGEFPAQAGKVMIGQSPSSPNGGYMASIVSWGQNSIVAGIPPAGTGATGYVYVVSNGIASNPVPLTEWIGTIDYTYVPQPFNFDTGPDNNQSVSGNLQASSDITTLFRDDVHKSRPGPGATPVQAGMKLQWATAGTTATFAASGTESGQLCNGAIGDQPQCEDVTDTWSPVSGTIPYTFDSSPFDPATTRLSLPATFCTIADNGPLQICMTSNLDVNPGIDDSGSGGETIGFMSCPKISLNDSTLLLFSYDATYAISSGTTMGESSPTSCAGTSSNARRRPHLRRAAAAAAGGSYQYMFRTLNAPGSKTPG
jgi:hypothetical protein